MTMSSKIIAQPFTVFASGFSNLIGISRDSNGNLFVAEAGSGINDSRISMITPAATVYPLVVDLPSFIDTVSGEVSGAWRAQMISASTLMVVVGPGADTNAGSIMFFDLSSFVPGSSTPLTDVDADSILHVFNWVMGQGFLESDPYSAAMGSDGNIYIADAAANAIIKYDFVSQNFSVLDTFPGFPNPFGPPPTIDYVPTRIINNPSGGFFMCNLGGFFPTFGQIISVDESGNTTLLDSGLTALVDMQFDGATGDKYALQFGEFDSLFHPVPGSAKIFRIDPLGNISLAYTGFGPSAGFVLDGNGGAYVTEIGTGNVLYFSDITSVKQISEKPFLSASVFPNPFTSSVDISLISDDATNSRLIIKNVSGEIVYSTTYYLNKGENRISWNGRSTGGAEVPSGNYFITIQTPLNSTTLKMLKQ